MKKLLFWSIWGVILSLGLITVIRDRFSFDLNFFQRLFGLTAFALLFTQIMLGAYMNFFTDKLGGWVFGFHVKQGMAIYTLIVLHPILFLLQKPPLMTLANPFYLMGTLSFILVSLAVWAARLRAEPFWNIHWRKFHYLNYAVFFLIVVHAWGVGSDFMQPPFLFFHPLASLAVLITIWRRLGWRFDFAGLLRLRG